ncbi:PP2C family protein-serine/threonine phosphatase [Niabella insulamsoli]|uniref:PP2C family protein-serine/threonine phosphatase n=1 Tax=Niabella insulamsoli TaxID=3144874 RepID=UPI0031FDD582
MSGTIFSHVQTDIGRRRDNNEDNFVWLQPLWSKSSLALIGAIDGVGGYDGGEEASAIAKTTIENYLQNFSFGAPLQLLREAFINANNTIHEQRAASNLPRMSCVASVAMLDSEKELMYVAHVGDSRGYVFRNGELIKITKDHSVVGFKEDSGYLTETEAMHHPNRNEISKMLGEYQIDAGDKDNYFDFFEHSFLPGDFVLFCTDGLTDLLNKQGITEILTQDIDIKQKAQLLINAANDLGGKDNITVALASFASKKAAAKKRVSKQAIEVPINEEEGLLTIVDKKPPRKKKQWWWWLPVVFLAGFLANWPGTKKIMQGKESRVDTIYIKDTLPFQDSLFAGDTLIQATDTIFRDSTINRNNTGY